MCKEKKNIGSLHPPASHLNQVEDLAVGKIKAEGMPRSTGGVGLENVDEIAGVMDERGAELAFGMQVRYCLSSFLCRCHLYPLGFERAHRHVCPRHRLPGSPASPEHPRKGEKC